MVAVTVVCMRWRVSSFPAARDRRRPRPQLGQGRDDAGWRFDAAAGKEAIINRRIGRNELHVIGVMRELVEAQEDYAAADPTDCGVRQYAQRILSAEGQRDGLYWPANSDNDQSPLGEDVADAVTEKLAAAMTEYDPDDSWSPVDEEEIDEADATVNP
jgi:hypothetical protein